MANQVRIGVGVTGAKGAASELDQLRDKFTKLQSQGAKGFAIGVGAAVTTKALNLLGGVVGDVTDFIGEATQAFIEDQHSIQQLNTSLKANVAGWNGNTDAIEAYVKANIALGFADDEQRSSLAGLVAATHDVGEALKIESVAMDLARFKGISLAEASQALTKVEAGSYRVLKSLGIQLKDGATQTEALAAVEKVASGQAEDFAGTLEGRLAVAAARTKEAEEQLGEQTAELSADFAKAKADAIEDFAKGLDFVTDTININNQSVERRLELGAEVIAMNPLLSQSDKDAAIAALQLALNNYEAVKSEKGLADWSGKAADDTFGLATAAQTGAGAVDKLGMTADEAAAATKDLDGAISGLSSTIEDELFGKAITAGNEARLRDNIKDLEHQREAAHKGSLKWIELTGEIAENRKALFDLHLTEAAAAGPAAAIAFLKKEETHAGAAKDEIAALIKKYQALADLQGDLGPIIVVGGASHGPARKRASGGPVSKGVAYTVGEQGPETFVAPSNGTIVPNGGSSGGGGGMSGGGLTIIVQGVSVLTPGSAEALARQLEPVITRAQQRRGQLAGARAF